MEEEDKGSDDNVGEKRKRSIEKGKGKAEEP